eukprot:Nk52_evm17s250 gene=Nk52_evmTU17s250
MTGHLAKSLISVSQLGKLLQSGSSATSPRMKILDCSWYMPFMKRDAKAEFEQERIEGAFFFDIDQHCDQSNEKNLPHMMPCVTQFEEAANWFGIRNDDHVVVYDGSGMFFSAPRVWYTFKTFGHKNVSVLDGGFKEWKRLNMPVELTKKNATEGATDMVGDSSYKADFQPHMVRDIEYVDSCLRDGTIQVVDARSAGRFAGTDPEPRPEISSGHMRGAVNIPFTLITKPETFVLKSSAELEKLFGGVLDLSRPIVGSCGSGVSASALLFALDCIGKEATLFDGSWTEWGMSGKEILKGQ